MTWTQPARADDGNGAGDVAQALLPPSLLLERHDAVAVLRVNRVAKRNALDDATVLGLESFFAAPPAWARAAVLDAAGKHFSAGLDLSELTERSTVEGNDHSPDVAPGLRADRAEDVARGRGAARCGHRGRPGARLRHAYPRRRALVLLRTPRRPARTVVGGGGSVHVPRLVGVHQMADMMQTGRVYDAADGHAIGFSNYLVGEGEGLATAVELARKIARNAPVTNFAVLQVRLRIAQANPGAGYSLESLMAAVATGSDEAKSRLGVFLDGRAAKVRHGGDQPS